MPFGPESGARRIVTVFDRYHPAVALLYFTAVLVFSMAAMQPVYLVLSVLGALSYTAWLKGPRAAVRTLAWQMPLVAVIAVLNPLFSSVGSTELFRIGHQAVYAESFAYGVCMGLMLMAVLLWFSSASRVLASDKVMALFGNVAPTIALMLSMAARLVPQFVGRGKEIDAVQAACAKARPIMFRERVANRGRIVTVLMGWAMEDSLERADAMRSRGWATAGKRTQYRAFRFRAADAIACVIVGALAACNGFLAWIACSQYSFYPTMSTLTVWWGYLPYALMTFLPLLAEAVDGMRWNRGTYGSSAAKEASDGRA